MKGPSTITLNQTKSLCENSSLYVLGKQVNLLRNRRLNSTEIYIKIILLTKYLLIHQFMNEIMIYSYHSINNVHWIHILVIDKEEVETRLTEL